MRDLFTVVVVLDVVLGGEVHELGYTTIDRFYSDGWLKELLDRQGVESCTVYRDGEIVANPLPKMLLTWDRLKDQVTSNSAKMLRGHYS